MSKKGENIYRRKDNRWEARIVIRETVNGEKKSYSIYAKSYAEAKQKKQEFLTAYTRKMAYLSKASDGDAEFSMYVEEWLDYQRTKVKPSTYSTYLRIIQGQILPDLGHLRMWQISEETLEEFFTRKSVIGKKDGSGGLSPKSVNDISTLLNNIFNYLDNKYSINNPMKKRYRIKLSKNSIEILTEQEVKQLTAYLAQHISCDSIGILIGLYSGLRLGEVCALRWSDVDFRLSLLKVRNTACRVMRESLEDSCTQKTKLILSTPKSASSIRDVPMLPFLTSILESMSNCYSDEDFLLTGNKHCMDPRTYQNHFKKYLQICGIRPMHYHCLRHTFATTCVALDFDIKTLSEILGHANTAITLDRYVHSSIARKQAQMSKFSDMIPVSS